MPDITVSYSGSSIATINASGTTTLGTGGKWCEDDITLTYVKPSGSSYVKLGEKDFTANTTSTTAISLGNLTLSGSSIWTSSKIIYISIIKIWIFLSPNT